MDPERTVGQRVGDIRRARGIDRAVLADQVGYSVEWLKSIETGRRSLDRYSVITALADALRVEIRDLLPLPGTASGDRYTSLAHLAIPPLRRALLHAEIPGRPQGAPTPLDDLRSRLNVAHRRRRHAHYGELATDLPQLLADTANTALLTTGRDREVAHGLLAEARHDAAMLTKKLGYVDLASIAAAQALRAAAQAGDPLLLTAMLWTQAEVLMTAGAVQDAHDLTAAGLDDLDGVLGDDTREAWCLWGTLHLVEAVIRAQWSERADATGHLVEAAAAADRVGPDSDAYQTEFGPGNRAIHLVHVGVELGDGPGVLAAVGGVDLSGLPKERRARHGIDRALLYGRAGDDAQAMEELVAADKIAPESVRNHALVHELIGTAARRARQLSAPVAEAARRLGIPV